MAGFISIIWDLDDEPYGNVQKVVHNGLSKDDVENALEHPVGATTSRSSGRPAVFGYAVDGRRIFVVSDEIDEDTIKPRTAYPIP